MRKLVCLFAFAVIVHTGSAIKCYNCQSSGDNDCTDISKIPTAECAPLRDKFPPVCIRRVLQGTTGKNISLLCTSEQNGNECFSPSVNYTVADCSICQQDFCNGYGRPLASFNLVAISGLALVFFVAKYF